MDENEPGDAVHVAADGTRAENLSLDHPSPPTSTLDRREFLKVSAGTIATLALLPHLELAERAEAATDLITRAARPRPTFNMVLRRREDFLVLSFDFYNLIPRYSQGGSVLVRPLAGSEAWVVVSFPPQNVLEEAFLEAQNPADSDALKSPGSVGARLAGPTRLAFLVPSSVESIPYDAQALLNWAGWVQQVVPAARPTLAGGPPPDLREATPWETAIEMPWWLVLSPSAAAGLWTSRTLPRTVAGRTELWHTSLRLGGGRGPDPAPAARAVWARDWDGGTGPAESRPIGTVFGERGWPFKEQSLIPIDRKQIVLSTTVKATRPRPLEVNRLLLSTLGGWMDVRGEWDTQATQLDLESWWHRATQGRDHYVRVIRVGYLFPVGHRAVLIDITERKPGIPADGDARHAAAYLRKRRFIVVRQPERTYPGEADPYDGRAFPFTSIRLLTTITPKLDALGAVPLATPPATPINTSAAFIPSVGGQPFAFEAVGTDHEGREIPFSTPVVFVNGAADAPGAGDFGIYDPTNLAAVISAYNALGAGGPHPARPDVMLGGRPLAFAPNGASPGSTRYDTRSIRLLATPPIPFSAPVLDALFQQMEPPFAPVLQRAETRLESAEITGGAGLGWQGIGYLNEYVLGGFGPGEVFARLEQPTVVTFKKEGRGGGVATPDLKMTGLSRTHGAIGGDPALVHLGGPAAFDPAAVFAGAKLLGGISLADVVAPGGLDRMPRLRSSTVGPVEAPTAVESTLEWSPLLKSSGILKIASGTDLKIDGTFRRDLLDPDNSSHAIHGDLRKVSLTLAPGAEFIQVTFDRVSFSSESGRKSEIKVDIGDVSFLGALAFIRALSKYIKPVDGTPSGPYIDVTTTRVLAGLAFALPAVQIGAFVVENASVRNEVALPLDGTPVTTRFAFSTRDDPFHLTVLGLGGGGFVGLEIAADGPRVLDVSLEAGAMVALNVGVAKGKLEAFAGFYYRLEGGAAKYTAFVRMTGSLRVLGLVTVSAKFYLDLKYSPKSGGAGKFQGTASITYSIDLGVYEKDVTVKVSRTFAGDGADPFLIERVTPAEWTTYCNAFAVGA